MFYAEVDNKLSAISEAISSQDAFDQKDNIVFTNDEMHKRIQCIEIFTVDDEFLDCIADDCIDLINAHFKHLFGNKSNESYRRYLRKKTGQVKETISNILFCVNGTKQEPCVTLMSLTDFLEININRLKAQIHYSAKNESFISSRYENIFVQLYEINQYCQLFITLCHEADRLCFLLHAIKQRFCSLNSLNKSDTQKADRSVSTICRYTLDKISKECNIFDRQKYKRITNNEILDWIGCYIKIRLDDTFYVKKSNMESMSAENIRRMVWLRKKVFSCLDDHYEFMF